MKNFTRTRIWHPDYIADTIVDIGTAELRQHDISHLVFDLDNTLVHHGSNELTTAYSQHIARLQRSGFTVLLGSNTRRDIDSIRVPLGLVAVASKPTSFKPLPSFYDRVITACGVAPAHIAFVGDHMVNDVIGPNRAGLVTIFVTALHGRQRSVNGWYRRWLNRSTTPS